jgi:cobalt-zinc-cadmium efflux system protein
MAMRLHSAVVAHAHAHQHHHHHHAIGADAQRGPLIGALGLIVTLMAGELVAGAIAHSVALLTDAAHMLTDAGALALSLVTLRLAARPPGGAMTFGLKRVEPLSAVVNGAVLGALALVFTVEAIQRLIHPGHVHGAVVLVVALAAIPINGLATWILSRARSSSINIEGAFQHLLTDAYAFAATAVAGAVILTTGFQRADAIAALLVAVLMTRACVGLLGDAGRIFLEAAPRGIDPDDVGNTLARAPGVVSVHDLHVWELTTDFPSLSAHVVVGRAEDCHAARARLEQLLRDDFAIDHTTLQVEHEPGLLRIE